MVIKLLITSGNITLIPKEATIEKENENNMIEKNTNEKIERKKMTNTTMTRWEYQKTIHDISLSIL